MAGGGLCGVTLSLCCLAGSEVWHPICKQAARAEKKLKVGSRGGDTSRGGTSQVPLSCSPCWN